MTKNEIKQFLDDNKVTEKEVDEMWEYCSAFPEFGGEIVNKLRNQLLNWRDLNVLAAKSLFDLHKKIEEKVLNSILGENGKIN